MPLDGAFNAAQVTAARNKKQYMSIFHDVMHRYFNTDVSSTKVRLLFFSRSFTIINPTGWLSNDDSLSSTHLKRYLLND